MQQIDFERLRKDLIDYYEGALFAGGFCVAIVDISRVQNASNGELIQIAKELKINLDNYFIRRENNER